MDSRFSVDYWIINWNGGSITIQSNRAAAPMMLAILPGAQLNSKEERDTIPFPNRYKSATMFMIKEAFDSNSKLCHQIDLGDKKKSHVENFTLYVKNLIFCQRLEV